jgi:hypothetical protein
VSPATILMAVLGLLVVVHMTRTRFRRREVSVARFFRELPQPKERQRRIELSNPLRSASLYPQAAFLGLVLAALLPIVRGCRLAAEKDLGLWVVVDTSYSMATEQLGETRLALAQQEALAFLERAEGLAGDQPPCLRLSSFDMEVQEHLPASRSSAAFRSRLAELQVRSLGSEVSRLQQVLSSAVEKPIGEQGRGELTCQPTHRLVISDLPAPDWVGDQAATLIWRDISQPVDNCGITNLNAERNLLTGEVRALTLTATAYGRPSAAARLHVTSPDGEIFSQPVAWLSSGIWRHRLQRLTPGIYRFQLEPGGAFAGDDQAEVAIPAGSTIRVDWRLPQQTLAQQLGWVLDAEQAQLQVVQLGEPVGDQPVLVIGNHYGRGREGEISRFEEGDPLLEGLNLDVAESLGIAGAEPPPGFTPVLAGADGTWVARRSQPPGVYLPGLPTVGDQEQQHFSATLLFNGLRWLLAGSDPQPLYTLTSPAEPEPAATRLALHPGEGRTDHVPASRGDIEVIRPLSREQEQEPAWPWLLAIAGLLLSLEQGLATFGAARWR